MDFFGPASSELEDVLDWTLFWTGLVFLFLGSAGIILMLFSGNKIIRDNVLQNSFIFISFYMLIIGLFLMKYHKKIVVRREIKG